MPLDRDRVLLETVRTHRARLLAAFLHGPQDDRRLVADNLRRLVGGLVLAAVGCAGCVGYAVVVGVLVEQGSR